jgi:hypothetical protein
MFNFFKRDPAKEKLKLSRELYRAIATCSFNACNCLDLAGMTGKYERESLLTEICAVHINAAIVMLEEPNAVMDGWGGGTAQKAAEFIGQTLPDALKTLDHERLAKFLTSAAFGSPDLTMLRSLVVSEDTWQLVYSHHFKSGLHLTDEQVVDFAREYNPKLLALTPSVRCHNPGIIAAIRCYRLSHLEEISDTPTRKHFVVKLNDILIASGVQFEQTIGKLTGVRVTIR